MPVIQAELDAKKLALRDQIELLVNPVPPAVAKLALPPAAADWAANDDALKALLDSPEFKAIIKTADGAALGTAHAHYAKYPLQCAFDDAKTELRAKITDMGEAAVPTDTNSANWDKDDRHLSFLIDTRDSLNAINNNAVAKAALDKFNSAKAALDNFNAEEAARLAALTIDGNLVPADSADSADSAAASTGPAVKVNDKLEPKEKEKDDPWFGDNIFANAMNVLTSDLMSTNIRWLGRPAIVLQCFTLSLGNLSASMMCRVIQGFAILSRNTKGENSLYARAGARADKYAETSAMRDGTALMLINIPLFPFKRLAYALGLTQEHPYDQLKKSSDNSFLSQTFPLNQVLIRTLPSLARNLDAIQLRARARFSKMIGSPAGAALDARADVAFEKTKKLDGTVLALYHGARLITDAPFRYIIGKLFSHKAFGQASEAAATKRYNDFRDCLGNSVLKDTMLISRQAPLKAGLGDQERKSLGMKEDGTLHENAPSSTGADRFRSLYMKAGTPHEAAKNTRSVVPPQGSVVIGPTSPTSTITYGPEIKARIDALNKAWASEPAAATGVLPERDLTNARKEAANKLAKAYTDSGDEVAKRVGLHTAFADYKTTQNAANKERLTKAENEYLKEQSQGALPPVNPAMRG